MEDKENGPIYDDRVVATIEGLKLGKDRDELAKSFGLKHFKSLDIYMRRRGFRYENDNYIPETTTIEKLEEKEHDNLPVKAQKILIDFEEGGDPRSISKKYHFNSVEELGEYLENHNLYWNSDENKYELQLNIRSSGNDKDELEGFKKSDISQDSNRIAEDISSKSKIDLDEMAEYKDILELLRKNKNKLEQLLESKSGNGKLPNYAVPGINTTKTFSISSMLSSLVEEYSESKGVSQKNMLQIAMVEFLMNHGYKEEMQILLNRK